MFWRSFSPQCLGSAPFLCFSSGNFHIHPICLSQSSCSKLFYLRYSIFFRWFSPINLSSFSFSKLFYLRYSIFCLKIQPNRHHHHLRPTPWAEKAKVSMVDTLKVASVQLENDLHLNDCFCFSELLIFFWMIDWLDKRSFLIQGLVLVALWWHKICRTLENCLWLPEWLRWLVKVWKWKCESESLMT